MSHDEWMPSTRGLPAIGSGFDPDPFSPAGFWIQRSRFIGGVGRRLGRRVIERGSLAFAVTLWLRDFVDFGVSIVGPLETRWGAGRVAP